MRSIFKVNSFVWVFILIIVLLTAESYSDGLIDFVNLSYGWVVLSNESICHTNDGGITWKIQNSNSKGLVSVDFVNENIGWIVGNGGIVLKTINGGQEWITYQISNISTGLHSVQFINENNGWIVGENGLILHTTNGGGIWVKQNSGISDPLNDLSFVDLKNGWIVGSGTFPIFNYQVILHTTDGGDYWQNVDYTRGDALYTVHFPNSSVGYAGGYYGRIKYTKNGGQTWDFTRVGNESFSSVFFIDSNSGWIVGNTKDAIYRTVDGGKSWIYQNIDATGYSDVHFINDQVGFLLCWRGIFPNKYQVILKTENGGNSWISSYTGINDDYTSNLDLNFKLYQNYPNPFNLETIIQYSVPEHSHVVMEIFNIYGNKITILKDAVENAGNYSVKWNGKNSMNQLVSSGIHLCQIHVGKYQKTIRMLLLK